MTHISAHDTAHSMRQVHDISGDSMSIGTDHISDSVLVRHDMWMQSFNKSISDYSAPHFLLINSLALARCIYIYFSQIISCKILPRNKSEKNFPCKMGPKIPMGPGGGGRG